MIAYIIALALGIASWTFAEYMLHRFLGHEHKGRNFFKAEHSLHHSRANYFAPAYKKALAGVIVAGIFMVLLGMVLPFWVAIAYVVGFMGMYGVYELTHYRYHSAKPLKVFLFLRKHHFYHHFHNPRTNHGVTTRFWDRVFGTYHQVEMVRVPKAMSMDWLVADGCIRGSYVGHFRLAGK